MKSFPVIIIALFFIIFSCSSCKKCYTCTFSGGVVEKLCPKDFPDGEKDLKMSVKAYEAEGYTCVEDN